MKTKITSVKVRGRVEQFTNEADARSYAKKHGGTILAANAADGIGTQTSMPVKSPGLCALLGLSISALNTPGELECAYSANGGTSSPRDTDKIVNALISFWRTRRGGDVDDAMQFLQKKHPLLFNSSLAKVSGLR
jgi:hypothetical protein